MFQKTGAKFKVEEFVEITLAGQKPFEAVVFLSVGDRLIDLLNDQRQFIPVKRMDNSTVIMAKSNILSIVEKDPFAKPVDMPGDDIPHSKDVAEFPEDEFEGDDPDARDSRESGVDEDDLPPRTDDPAKGSAGGRAGGRSGAGSAGENADEDRNRRRRRRKKTPEFDAYAILKVSEDATLEEIRAAYKSRIKAVHPDSVAALDLDEELIRAAIQTTQRVNYAYHHILKERRNRSESEPDKAA